MRFDLAVERRTCPITRDVQVFDLVENEERLAVGRIHAVLDTPINQEFEYRGNGRSPAGRTRQDNAILNGFRPSYSYEQSNDDWLVAFQFRCSCNPFDRPSLSQLVVRNRTTHCWSNCHVPPRHLNFNHSRQSSRWNIGGCSRRL